MIESEGEARLIKMCYQMYIKRTMKENGKKAIREYLEGY